MKSHRVLLVVLFVGILAAGFFFYPHRFVRYQSPEFLTFAELKKLYVNPHPSGLLGWKLKKFRDTPVISNEAYYAGVKPEFHQDPKLGSYLGLASWNIGEEELFHLKDTIKVFSSLDQFRSLINPEKAPEGSPEYKKILQQRDRLAKADIIVLQEVNIGAKRSEYRDEAKEFAQALKMNYAYGAEQHEIDPVTLGVEKIYLKDGVTVDQEQTSNYAADPSRYKGVLGNAVFSRYPIKKVQVFQLKHVPYDWYAREKEKPGFMEKAREKGGEVLLKAEFTREVRVGTQIYFRVDLDVPGLPENTLTVINIHLEINCLPKEREAQVAEILSYTKNIKHPTVILGDFNAAPDDLSATSIKRVVVRTIENPTTWFSTAVSYLMPQALVINTTRFVGNYTKNFNDPLKPDIAVIAPNPLHPLFQMIQNYRFNDGGAFDFRGNADRSINGKDGALANSNERGLKGFKTTWRVNRPIVFLGKYRLDWIFVKGLLKNPYDESGPYRFAPHFGETLEELNTDLKQPISDHHPNVVDIAVKEPH